MPKYLWSELKIKNQRRYKGKGFKRKENTGIDTETYKGKCRLICDSFGEYAFINEFDDILEIYDELNNNFNTLCELLEFKLYY